MTLRALASVNVAAIERNATRLRARLAPGTRLCAVVKADASGHGAVPVSRAALAGGASSLAVSTADEAAQLRAAGIAAPVLVMGAVSADELPVAIEADAELVAWSERFVRGLLDGAWPRPIAMHVKLDSGMGRLGTRDVDEALSVAGLIASGGPRLVLAGAMTHLATADGDLEFAGAQLAVFSAFVDALGARADGRRADDPQGNGPGASGLVVHAANSAGTLRLADSHFDMVRCGIALYGCDPMNEDPDAAGLEPALELSSYVAAVKRAQPGDSVGYGRRFVAERPTWIGTLPIGYADGVRRGLTNNGEVLIDGRRFPIVGTVSMDNVTIDLGAGPSERPPVETGSRAILIGRSGSERLTVEDMARRIGTINHEVLCGISSRVPRRYHRDGVPI
ncbi:MAG: alanine racemase [Solirubrobacteraceae bacterium]